MKHLLQIIELAEQVASQISRTRVRVVWCDLQYLIGHHTGYWDMISREKLKHPRSRYVVFGDSEPADH